MLLGASGNCIEQIRSCLVNILLLCSSGGIVIFFICPRTAFSFVQIQRICSECRYIRLFSSRTQTSFIKYLPVMVEITIQILLNAASKKFMEDWLFKFNVCLWCTAFNDVEHFVFFFKEEEKPQSV